MVVPPEATGNASNHSEKAGFAGAGRVAWGMASGNTTSVGRRYQAHAEPGGQVVLLHYTRCHRLNRLHGFYRVEPYGAVIIGQEHARNHPGGTFAAL